jgi:hypothetical protein
MKLAQLSIGVVYCWSLFCGTAFASVQINEIAWMGTAVSGTSEWIELYNPDVAPVDLSGWRIDADDGSPSIPLSGTIGAKGYFLIERTTDASVPDVPADLVAPFGNGLSNSGETLRLKNAALAVMDTVVGGTNWSAIGGNNDTKETAQRTSLTTWATGVGTPRAQNIGAVTGDVAVTQSATTTATSSQSGTQSGTQSSGSLGTAVGGLKSPYPRKNIVAEAGEDKRAFTEFSVTFVGSSTGLYNEQIPRATYRWNFGDGTTANERSATHSYDFPGEYVVTLEVFLGEYHATDRLSLIVTDPLMEITSVRAGRHGFISLLNRSGSEIDLSSWSLTDGKKEFYFPSNSIVPPQKTLILPNRVSLLGMEDVPLALITPSHVRAAMWGDATEITEAQVSENEASIAQNSEPAVLSSPPRTSPREGLVSGTPLSTAGETKKSTPVLASVLSSPELIAEAPTSLDSIAESPQVLGETFAQPALRPHPLSAVATETSVVLWSGASSHEDNKKIFGVPSTWLFASGALFLGLCAVLILLKSTAPPKVAGDEFRIIEDIIEGRDD